jgi:hypothetical protein
VAEKKTSNYCGVFLKTDAQYPLFHSSVVRTSTTSFLLSLNMAFPSVSFRAVVNAVCLALLLADQTSAFRVSSPRVPVRLVLPQQRSMTAAPKEGIVNDSDDEGDDEVIAQAVVKMDDGGSNLTDRFKYQVRRSKLVNAC